MIFDKVIVFDTNVFKNITRKGHERKYENLFVGINALYNNNNQYSGFYHAITPFLFLECIGQVAPKFDENNIFTDFSLCKKYNEAIKDVFEKASNLYDSSDLLSEENLKKKYIDNVPYLSTPGAENYELILGKIVKSNDFTNLIKKNLALDFTYRYPFEKSFKEEDLSRIHLEAIFDIYRAHDHKANLTQMRGIISLCKALEKLSKGKIENETTQLLKEIRKIKKFQDLVDLDLIQICCLGMFLNNKKYKVIAFTQDPKEPVVKRIKVFKTIFTSFKSLLVEKGELSKLTSQIEDVDFFQGIIHFVDKDKGHIIDTVDVEKIELAEF